MDWFRKTLLVMLAGLTNLALAGAAGAADPGTSAVRIESIQVGFDGIYKTGHWMPVRVTLSCVGPGTDVELRIAARDSDGVEAVFAQDSDGRLRLNADGRTDVVRYVKAGRADSGLTVRVTGSSGELAARTFAAHELGAAEPSTQELLVGLAPAIGLEEVARRARRDRAQAITVATVVDPHLMPTVWYGYDAIDVVVATTGEAGVLESLSDAQFEALDSWLQLGGRMVLCAGRRGAEVFAPDSRLARFSPGRDAEAITQRVTSGLENYAGASERLDTVGGERARRLGVPMTAVADVRGVVESLEVGGPAGRVPTIVRFPYGLGQITFLAFDPELPPLDQWQGRGPLMARVLQVGGAGRYAAAEADARLGQVTHLGYEDLAGQLRSALDQFPGVTRIQFSWVAGLLAVYVLFVGPLDYLLLKRFDRLTWTWLSSILIAIVFCGLAYGAMHRLTGRDVHVNYVDLVDVDLDQGVLRGSMWTHVYSPATERFTLQWHENRPVAPDRRADTGTSAADLPSATDVRHRSGRLLSWQGLPGSGLGGLDSRGGAALFAEPYLMTPGYAGPDEERAEIRGLPIEVSGTKSLAGTWWALDEAPPAQRLSANVHGLLAGQLTNPLDVELTDCMVFFENWMYPVAGTLAPGKAVTFDGVSPRNLEWHLSRRRVVETRDVVTRWDQASTDVSRILEMMMFYRAAGGAAYTGLTHRYQTYVDLSEHLRTGRAILVGRSAAAGSRLVPEHAGGDASRVRQWTFYRIVFPVDRSERAAIL